MIKDYASWSSHSSISDKVQSVAIVSRRANGQVRTVPQSSTAEPTPSGAMVLHRRRTAPPTEAQSARNRSVTDPSCFAVLVDHVPAAAQAARTAWVSCGVVCSGRGLRNLAAMMTRRSFDGHVVVGRFGLRGVPAGPGPVTGHVVGGVSVQRIVGADNPVTASDQGFRNQPPPAPQRKCGRRALRRDDPSRAPRPPPDHQSTTRRCRAARVRTPLQRSPAAPHPEAGRSLTNTPPSRNNRDPQDRTTRPPRRARPRVSEVA